MKQKEIPIDFVVTWVDSTDESWIADYCKYRGESYSKNDARFRNWDLFRFRFRAIEKFAPWVNKIYLVTNGHYPKWLNINHPKLVLVKHSDYIPSHLLPTFNSTTIELNMGRIKGLSEYFVYFNDDTFLNSKVSPDYYFKNGLPVDFNLERLSIVDKYDPIEGFNISLSLHCNLAVMNYFFNRNSVIKQSPRRWFGPHLSGKQLLSSIIMLTNNKFHGFITRHIEQPFLKSSFDDAWEKVPYVLEKSCSRFRKYDCLNIYFIRQWQFANNLFVPSKEKGTFYNIIESNLDKIIKSIDNDSIQSLCINDTPICNESFFNIAKEKITEAFIKKFPNKSDFEL